MLGRKALPRVSAIFNSRVREKLQKKKKGHKILIVHLQSVCAYRGAACHPSRIAQRNGQTDFDKKKKKMFEKFCFLSPEESRGNLILGYQSPSA